MMFYLHLLFFLYSLGGIFSKSAGREEFLSPKFIFLYSIALFILFVYALCWQQIIKKMPLTTAYFNRAVCILWGFLWGYLFFHEQITFNAIVGAFIVILGIIAVAYDE